MTVHYTKSKSPVQSTGDCLRRPEAAYECTEGLGSRKKMMKIKGRLERGCSASVIRGLFSAVEVVINHYSRLCAGN